MPRITHRFPKPSTQQLSTNEQLRNLHLAVRVRSEQVKLRRLEWDTQKIALPHITPMPGDGPLQIRESMTKDDLPTPKPPREIPQFESHMDTVVYGHLIKIYMDAEQREWDRNPYNWLASISAQEKLDAKG